MSKSTKLSPDGRGRTIVNKDRDSYQSTKRQKGMANSPKRTNVRYSEKLNYIEQRHNGEKKRREQSPRSSV